MTQAQFNKVQLWRDRFKQFEKSSLTAAQFCQSVGCSMAAFYKWRNKLLGQPKSARAAATNASSVSPSPFLQVSTTSNLAISIQLPSGIVLTVPIEAIDCLPSILQRVA